jgi:hypothetical protein
MKWQENLIFWRSMTSDFAMLRRLWPNREHESNWLKGLACAVGLHRWHTLNVDVFAGAVTLRLLPLVSRNQTA